MRAWTAKRPHLGPDRDCSQQLFREVGDRPDNRPGPFLLWHCLQRALALAHLGEHAKATAEADELSHATGGAGAASYDLACVYALASAAARKDGRLPPDECDRLAERYAAAAVAFVSSARAAGFFKSRANIEHLAKDPDLETIRSRADFRKLRSELEVE